MNRNKRWRRHALNLEKQLLLKFYPADTER